MTRAGLRAVRCALLFCCLMPLLMAAGCTRPAPAPDSEAQLAALDPEARRLYQLVEQEHLLRRHAQVLALGDRLLATYPDHPLADVVTWRMITAAARSGDLDRAYVLSRQFPRWFPGSEHLSEAMLAGAAGLADGERPDQAIEVLAELAAAQATSAQRQVTVDRARQLAATLDDAVLLRLAGELAGTPVAPVLVAQREARRLTDQPAPTVTARSGRIGVLVPLTGRYARFGNAYQAAVRLAGAAVPPIAPSGIPAADPAGWQFVLEDSEGDVVAAALAARRLITEQHCQVLIGALLSAPTATAALVADQHGVPLVSPSATHERLGALSDQVVQTNLTGRLEAEILAQLAREVLLKERFAIIRPDSPEGLSQAEAFATAVARLGGLVVREVVYDPAAIDFRTQIQALRLERPEVIFAPATVDQMILLGPQLDFYQIGALVLGPSDWNSARLLQRAGSVMEQAICAGPEIVYPARWSADFARAWPAGRYDEESTRIARGVYLATRMVLQTLSELAVAEPATERVPVNERAPVVEPARAAARDLAASLRARFTERVVELHDAESFAAAVRLVQGGELVPFPGHLYAEALWRDAAAAAAAAADTALHAAEADTIPPGAMDRPMPE